MRLLAHLILRLVGVVLLCLACAIGWIVWEAKEGIRVETEASAARVARDLQALYWRQLLWRGGLEKTPLLPLPEWQTVQTLRVVSPGICVTFAPANGDPKALCSQVEGVGASPPAWFAGAYETAFGAHPSASLPLTVRQLQAGTITAAPEPTAALRQVWGQVRIVTGIAAAMAAGIGLLAALLIGHAVMPARTIARALRRLESGEYGLRLPAFATAEFRHIGRAVDDLAGRLARTTAERAALTKRLFQVQEEERRALARDLHDEFGQCLTATAALAAAIEAGAEPDRPDLAAQARSVSRVTARMMESLKEALSRLRSQDLDELGLEASLAQLVSGWNARSRHRGQPRSVFRLDVAGNLAAVPAQAAVSVYRIAQECLTNAARHGLPRADGRPAEVRLTIEHAEAAEGRLRLVVEDEGGGDPARLDCATGRGILGIRERIASLGGSLSIARAERGLRIAAVIPLRGPRLVPAVPAAA
ncbi:sensor histidine kinase [Methylobacterium haplocladii]|uniref:Histidine kinase n=1 Tax=Methylobacterium haplocladii TaxID=1176176 RepID=A0A512IP45_9HYPH|nr:histidine kinase [Methylobacterium haplocladii]GEO99473.1 histidine kinase [Methylobacterium haplocladii]